MSLLNSAGSGGKAREISLCVRVSHSSLSLSLSHPNTHINTLTPTHSLTRIHIHTHTRTHRYDWAPTVVTQGIWLPIYILLVNKVRGKREKEHERKEEGKPFLSFRSVSFR